MCWADEEDGEGIDWSLVGPGDTEADPYCEYRGWLGLWVWCRSGVPGPDPSLLAGGGAASAGSKEDIA